MNNGQVGGFQFGGFQFGGINQIETSVILPPVVTGNRRSQLGFDYLYSRQYNRSYEYVLPRRSAIDVEFAGINITSVSGALIGKIRTDVQNSLVHSLEFTLDENGCADFILKLNTFPKFEILPSSMLTINIGNSDFDWYKGILMYPAEPGTDTEVLEFRGFGLRKFLETLRADTDFSAGSDLTVIIEDLIQNWIAPFCPIRYNPSKIDVNTGVILGTAIELGKFSIRQVLDTLSQMAITSEFYYNWGVDGDGDFYWTRYRNDVTQRTFIIGDNLNNFKPKINYQDVKNVITVQRQEGRGAGGAGWSVAAVRNDPTSIKLYGRQELNYQIPGFFENDVAEILGDALLEDKAQPKTSAKTDHWQANTGLDFLTNGIYRFINPLGEYQENVSPIDSKDEFNIIGGGDMAAHDDNNFFIFADGGVRLDFTNSDGTRAELDIEADGLIQEIRFYVRASASGAYLTAGVGATTWNQYTIDIDVPFSDTFIPIVWDLRNQNIRHLGKFALRVNGDFAAQRSIWIDKLDILFKGNKTYRMKLKRSVYRYVPSGSGVQSDFGVLPNDLVDFVAGLQATAQSLKFTGEIR